MDAYRSLITEKKTGAHQDAHKGQRAPGLFANSDMQRGHQVVCGGLHKHLKPVYALSEHSGQEDLELMLCAPS